MPEQFSLPFGPTGGHGTLPTPLRGMQDASVSGPSERSSMQHGADLLARGDWAAARDAFSSALEEHESPDSHDGLASALWWLGVPDDAIEHRERAFVLWKK